MSSDTCLWFRDCLPIPSLFFPPDAEEMTVSGSRVYSQQRPSAGGSVILHEGESVLMSSLHSVAPDL